MSSANSSTGRQLNVSQLPTCSHYQRRCSIITPCCNRVVCCISGHDSGRSCSTSLRSYRTRINTIVCNNCGVRQAVSGQCRYCRVLFGRYFCRTCLIWDSGPAFHCTHCGYCVAARRSDTRHCFVCNKCYPLTSLHHNCASSSVINGPCAVCGHSMHASRQRLHTTRCRHTMHEKCFLQRVMLNFSCPNTNCRQPIADASDWRRALDTFTARSGNERMHVRVRCNGCGTAGLAVYRSGQAPCTVCGSTYVSRNPSFSRIRIYSAPDAESDTYSQEHIYPASKHAGIFIIK